MKLGVFDSGIGGEAIASSLQLAFPSADIICLNDRSNLPYGDKSAEEIRQLTNNAIQPLIGSDVIVIACNSATTAALNWLRQLYPEQKFIGIEPMVKPAAAITKTGIIAVCATPATLASERYRALKSTYAPGITVIEPDCRSWAAMVEDNSINEAIIAKQIEPALDAEADVIVLGCTHYHWIKDEVETVCNGKAQVLEPSTAIAAQVQTLIGSNVQL